MSFDVASFDEVSEVLARQAREIVRLEKRQAELETNLRILIAASKTHLNLTLATIDR